MTETEIRAALLALRPLSDAATPCHWYCTEKEVDGSGGISGYESYEIESHAGPDGRRVSLFDAINSDVARVEHDRSGESAHQWDVVAKANLGYVAALVNLHRQILEDEAKAHRGGRSYEIGSGEKWP